MKNIFKILSLLVILSLSSLAKENCKIITSSAPSGNKVRGMDTIVLSLSKAYYDKNKKLQIRSFKDALFDFDSQARNMIKKDCKKYGIRINYNYKINSIIDENYYHFYATYDYQ